MPDADMSQERMQELKAMADIIGERGEASGGLLTGGAAALKPPQTSHLFERERIAQQQYAMNLHRSQQEAPLRLRCLELAISAGADDPVGQAARFWTFVQSPTPALDA